MKKETPKLFKRFIFMLILGFYFSINIFGQAVSINTTGNAPDASAILDISSTDKGLLIPRVTLDDATTAAPVAAPVDGLMIYNATGTEPHGLYIWSSADSEWKQLYNGTVPTVPGNTEYWIRPAAPNDNYIHPEYNSMIKVYDAGETYGIHYDGGTNQYGIWARTTDITDPTAAVVGFSDVSGNQTYGYLGYNGTYSFAGQTTNGSSVYGIAEDPDRAAGFFRSTSNASVAANINYSDVWMASYNFVENKSNTYNPSCIYGQLQNSDETLGGNQYAILGLSNYEGTANGTGVSMGGYFQGWGLDATNSYSQASVGIYADAYNALVNNNPATGLKAASNASTVWAHPMGYGAAIEATGYTGGGYFDLDQATYAGNGYYYGNTWSGLFADAWPGSGTNGSMYFFGVHGSIYDTDADSRQNQRSGGVLGSFEDGGTHSAWGSLAYHASNRNYYGVYGSTGYASGGGKNINYFGTGVAGNGSLFGAWFNGEIYGMAVKGNRYGLYVSGKQYINEIITQLSDNGTQERTATYVPTSMTVDIYMKGTGTLVNGKANITFDKKYQDLISDKEPVIVTVTPMGQTNGVYLESVKANGFSIIENNAGKSNTTFTWIAVATRKGYENPNNPNEVMANDYDTKLGEHMFNESDLEHEGKPMWFDGSEIHYSERQDPVIKLNVKKRKAKTDTKIKIYKEIKDKNTFKKQVAFKKEKLTKE